MEGLPRRDACLFLHSPQLVFVCESWARVCVRCREFAPIEFARVEFAPIESAPIEFAPIEFAPIEFAPIDAKLQGMPPCQACSDARGAKTQGVLGVLWSSRTLAGARYPLYRSRVQGRV